MTFLHFVTEHLMGPPACGSCWPCPFCDSSHGSLSVQPPKGNCAIKFRCHRCAKFGDEYDLLQLFYPQERYPARQARRAALYREWEQSTNTPPATQSTGERGRHRPAPVDDPLDVALAWAELIEEFREDETPPSFALQVIKQTIEACRRNGVSPQALILYWESFNHWMDEGMDREIRVREARRHIKPYPVRGGRRNGRMS